MMKAQLQFWFRREGKRKPSMVVSGSLRLHLNSGSVESLFSSASGKEKEFNLAHGLTGINWNEKEREREQHRIGSHTEFSSLGLPFLGQIPQKE